MTYGHKYRTFAATIFLLSVFVSPAAAEELTLKNGQKIVGTIVGFENGMFRVETEFGFAEVRKDKVESIDFTPAAAREATKKRSDAKTSAPSAPSEKASAPVPAQTFSVTVPRLSEALDWKPAPPPVPPAALSAPKRTPVAALPAVQPTVPPPPPVSRPLDEPLPAHLEEHLEGNNYVNDTFHFAMFRPPGWKTYEGVPRETGSAIVAIGTEDEQTLLFVDRQVWSGVPDLKSEQAIAKLRETYQEYKKLSESTTELDGHPAIRRVFSGVIDGAEWHGLSLHVTQGNTVFGIVGLTSAETSQFEQALFNKIIKSFHFLTPTTPVGAASPAAPRR